MPCWCTHPVGDLVSGLLCNDACGRCSDGIKNGFFKNGLAAEKVVRRLLEMAAAVD